MTVARVKLWGMTVGAVAIEEGDAAASFEYAPEFRAGNLQVSPITMPLGRRVYSFPDLPNSFLGLPGLLADSLPDRFGQAVIDAWLATQGRTPESFNVVERLCYIGARGMGALEFEPALWGPPTKQNKLNVSRLADLASEILAHRGSLVTTFEGRERAVRDILRVGSSAGGARAKAVIAWNPETNEVRSGQIQVGDGFEYWLLKFDGVNSRDQEFADPEGYGAIELAYADMAKAAGIRMSECRLFEEGGRRHFMTRRFDRAKDGEKIHMQTLGALAHYDLNLAGAVGYEQGMQVMRRLRLSMDDIEEFFRRMAFNVMARNQDDHVKNIAYLMHPNGTWSLAPAFDLTYAYNPRGEWTSSHQMTINGKRDGYADEDFAACARAGSMKRGRYKVIMEEVRGAVSRWRLFAEKAGVDAEKAQAIGNVLRLG